MLREEMQKFVVALDVRCGVGADGLDFPASCLCVLESRFRHYRRDAASAKRIRHEGVFECYDVTAFLVLQKGAVVALESGKLWSVTYRR